MKLHSRASANSTIKMIMSNAKGIGESKTQAKRESDIIGQNGQNISSKAHSVASTQNLRTVVTQYTNFIKDEYGGRVVKNMNSDTMKEFIDKKIEDGLKLSSVNTYISELGKVSDNLNQLGVDTTSRTEITNYRDELKERLGSLQSEKVDRTNFNPQQIVQEMYNNTPFGLSSQLQYELGLRIDDATNFNKLTINEDNTLLVKGSKNGNDYTTTAMSNSLKEKLSEAKEMGIKINKTEYRESMKEVVINLGQEWHGTHSLRFDYANDAYNENKLNGLSDSESKINTSLNMGHSRESITDRYLK